MCHEMLPIWFFSESFKNIETTLFWIIWKKIGWRWIWAQASKLQPLDQTVHNVHLRHAPQPLVLNLTLLWTHNQLNFPWRFAWMPSPNPVVCIFRASYEAPGADYLALSSLTYSLSNESHINWRQTFSHSPFSPAWLNILLSYHTWTSYCTALHALYHFTFPE